MKRAAAHLFKRESKNRAFFEIIKLFLWFKTPVQDKGAKTRPQGQLEFANPRGSPGGDGQAWNWLMHYPRVELLVVNVRILKGSK